MTPGVADPALTEFRQGVRAFADEVVAPRLSDWESRRTLPGDAFVTFARAGLIGQHVPRALGGAQRTIVFGAVVAEEMARIGASGPCTSLMIVSNVVCPLLAEYGSNAQQERWLGPLIRGEAVASIALTEPGGGSDPANAIQTTARRDGGSWVLDGEKMFITNAPIADLSLVLARTAERPGPLGMTLFAVPAEVGGLHVAQLDKLGLRSSPVGRLTLRECRIEAAEAVVGRVNRGYLQAAKTLESERLLIAVSAVATARACVEATLSARSSRSCADVAARGELAGLLASVEAGRALAWQQIERAARGAADAVSVALTKATLGDLAQSVVIRCHQLAGAPERAEGTLLERAVRDVRVASVFAGTSETMRDFASLRMTQATRRSLAQNGTEVA